MNDAPAVISTLPAKAARMLAVEILLAYPETLGDDVLESCLYILRARLREGSVKLTYSPPAARLCAGPRRRPA